MMAARYAPISRERILAAFPVGRWFVTPARIADRIGCRPETVRKRLAQMHAAGELERATGPQFGKACAPYTYRRREE